MNTFLNELKNELNYTVTENGAIAHKSTLNKVYDMFAFGGACRSRTNKEIEDLFIQAFVEDKELALKCLFYLRDCRGGQGERRFFRICFHWLSLIYPEYAIPLLIEIPTFGRWDDLWYSVYGERYNKKVFEEVLNIIKNQIMIDCQSKTCSLLAKWLPSENASSIKTKEMANIIRIYLGLSHKEYRKMLSFLRKKINILERLMSENRWDEIEFDKIPSKAGLIYRNAFARKEVIAEKYKRFMEDKTKKVNTSVLCPYDIFKTFCKTDFYGSNMFNHLSIDEINTVQKYWDNLPDYFNGKSSSAIAVVDVSGSMYWDPLFAALSMGAYVAERNEGAFKNHFITFSENPELIEFKGKNIVEKVQFCSKAKWGFNTNIEAVFDLFLNALTSGKVCIEDVPKTIYIFSDMEFDAACRCYSFNQKQTLIETIEKKWKAYGYEMPNLVFWNLNSRQNNIPALGSKVTCISGFSPVMIEQVLSGKTGIDVMLDKLLSDRYKDIKIK